MAPRATAIWKMAEETAFLDYLVEAKAEAGDGGNFKKPTFQAALERVKLLWKEGLEKTVKTLQNKWATFRNIYRVVTVIMSVSGWVWSDDMGASINADTASSWDDYVLKHPDAKPFRNKGWVHLHNMELLMPSTMPGANVFHPTGSTNDTQVDNTSDRSPSPLSPSKSPAAAFVSVSESDEISSPMPAASSSRSQKQACEPTTTPVRHKCLRSSGGGAAALLEMSNSLSGFGSTLAAALAPPATIDTTPIRRHKTVTTVLEQEDDWLEDDQVVALLNFLRNDPGASDTYRALTKPTIRQAWIHAQLDKLGVFV